MSTVTVPAEVAKALDHYKEAWSQFSDDEKAFLFMGLGSQKASNHEAEVLKSFAQQNPIAYMQAFVSGYEAEISLKEDVAVMIRDWLNQSQSWTSSRIKECEKLSSRLIEYIQSRS